jgi:N-acetyl-anhydromuramyl-L-alanine amidase AmpD
MHLDARGWLVADAGDPSPVVLLPSERHSSRLIPVPSAVVWHVTGGRGDSPAAAARTVDRIRAYDKTDERSFHFLVATDGTIYQAVSCLRAAWHTRGTGEVRGHETHVNRATVGVELQNAGRLVWAAGHCYCWPWFKRNVVGRYLRPLQSDPSCEVDGSRAVAVAITPHRTRFYDRFTDPQSTAAAALLATLVAAYSWLREACSYGHSDFDLRRRPDDPGELWRQVALPGILSWLFGSAPSPANSALSD